MALHRELYLAHRGSIMPDGKEELFAYRDFEQVLRDDVDAMLSSATHAVLVATMDGEEGEVIGYVTGHVVTMPRRVLPKKGVVGDWFVLPSVRGRGIGKQLLETLAAIFRESGCEVMESATWPFNEGARAAHEQLGFSEVQVTYRKRLAPKE